MKQLLILVLILGIMPVSAYGHGLGLDTVSSITNGREISITVELPMDYTDEKQITITTTEQDENLKNVTLLIGLYHQDEMILRNYFFAEEGILTINVKSMDSDEVKILGRQDDLLGAWHPTDKPLEIVGPIFQTAGLYTFEIEIRTIDSPTNIIENQVVSRADLSIIETREFGQESFEGEIIPFRIKSYFDKISDFTYDPASKIITFEMPFDWNEKIISHIPVVHIEVHFPKTFDEYNVPSYVGAIHGVQLFKSSITIDDYTEPDERIVHFVLLSDHLRSLKNQFNGDIPENMVFTLSTSDESRFPLTAYTANDDYSIDLAWDPPEITSEEGTIFIFTIRDGTTGEPLRQSSYDFVLIQNGKEIHRAGGEAVIGGAVEKFTFSDAQTGPTIIKFENIRGTGAETEFGFVVVPEFGTITMIFVITIISVIILNKSSKIAFK